GQVGLAACDLSTGAFFLQGLSRAALASALESLSPREILAPDNFGKDEEARYTLQPASLFNPDNGRKRLEALFGVGTLEGFGAFSRAEIAAAGALIDYIDRTQKGKIPYLSAPKRLNETGLMAIDAATRRSLELTHSLSSGSRKGSLLDCMDDTLTAPGARLLAARIEALLADQALCGDLRIYLREVPDMERALARITAGRGSPRDLLMIRGGIASAQRICMLLQGAGHGPLMALAAALSNQPKASALADHLREALSEDAPFLARDGGFVREGYHARLDELRGLKSESKRLIAGLQARYAQDTKIERLKITHNNVLGYFIEVTGKGADMMFALRERDPASPYIHRQTMANAARFTTAELGTLER
ncbi:MAG TPA: DNA mismatch repair protein MutS, partial [Alphaproteobacteria bacterium]|nr:DNA mismatch repair protein MutS [Alphaproteobacteria bacterium]